jgi:stage II sporulation protein AA (anti-sigma F factor antagonist)
MTHPIHYNERDTAEILYRAHFFAKRGQAMPITVTRRDDALTIALSGEIDHHGARTMMEQLDDAIAQRLPARLVLDLSGVNFMDSSGIAVLLRAKRQMDHTGGQLRVTAIPTQARRVLDAAGVGRLITLE